MAPAASVGPSLPSVPALKTTTSGEAGDVEGGGQDELLVAAAQSIAFDGDGGFAAGDDAGGRPDGASGGGDFAGDGGVHAGDLAGLALDGAGEHQRAVAQRAGGAGGGIERQAIAADDGVAHAGEEGIAGLGGLRDFAAHAALDAVADGGRHAVADVVAVENAAAVAKVETSGAVGPEPMTSRLSPMTSESSRDSTRAGAARRASWPPLMREMCLRTALISWMGAPQASSSRVMACFSSSVMPSAGRGMSAEAPPEIRQSTRSSRPARGGDLGDACAAGDAALIGHGVAALVQLDAAQFGEVAVLDVDQAGGDAGAEDALGGLRHGGSGFAGADHVDVAVAGEVAAGQVAGDGVGGVGGG